MWIHLLALELIDGASGDVAPTPAETPTRPGVRHARFLRRGPKLPWEEEESQVVIAKPRRKRIPLPAVKALKEAAGPIPIATVREISAPVISIPDVGTATLEDDDEDWLWLI